MPLQPHQRYVTDEAIDSYTAYIRQRTEAGLPWKRSAEILSNYLLAEPVYCLIGEPIPAQG